MAVSEAQVAVILSPYLAEELFEGFAADDVRVGFEPGLAQRLLEELGHFESHTKKLPAFLFLQEMMAA